MILPPRAFDVGVISIGMFVDPHTPALDGVADDAPHHQSVSLDVYFGDLDVLVCDLPPGTGDVAISLRQLVPTADVLWSRRLKGVRVTSPNARVSSRANSGRGSSGWSRPCRIWIDSDGAAHSMFGTGGGAEVAARLRRPYSAVFHWHLR